MIGNEGRNCQPYSATHSTVRGGKPPWPRISNKVDFAYEIAARRRQGMRRIRVSNGLIALAMALAAGPAAAQNDVAAFYRGKTITITNAFAEGGLYSNLARIIAHHLPHHIPGGPNAVPQFLPGAAGLRQMNHLYNAAAKDGTVLALMYDNMPITQALAADNSVKFDLRRTPALGSLSRGEPGVVGILKRAGIATIEDAKHKEAVFGATGTTSAQYYIPAIMNRLFATRFKLIPGFPTTPHTYLAMERGEVDGIYGAVETIVESRPQWIAEKRFNWIAQLNDVRAGEFADVPLLEELAQAPIDKAAFKLLALARVPGKPVLLPPDVPAERVAALRMAFEAMLKDKAFIGDVAKTTQVLEPRTWQDAERVIRETIDTPPEVVARVQELLKAAK
jgi:tripartite-type tricarboxylate transporter receptor subunit TctC